MYFFVSVVVILDTIIFVDSIKCSSSIAHTTLSLSPSLKFVCQLYILGD